MLFQADAAIIPFADKTFHACVTSPPYWGLRKYQGEQGRVWGGDNDCVHEWGEGRTIKTGRNDTGDPTSNIGTRHQSPSYGGEKETYIGGACQKCGAWYGSLGLEPTPQLHIQHIVEIFREVYRVLRDDGCVWLNYGDCYSAAGWESNRRNVIGTGSFDPADRKSGKSPGLSAGNLMLMPHRIAIALQDDGWVVRNDLIWMKRNPMPESCAGWRFEQSKKRISARGKSTAGVDKYENMGAGNPHASRDGYEAEYEYGEDYELRKGSWRHTRAHEFIFMLTKKMQYWSNQEAVREGLAEGTSERYEHDFKPIWTEEKGNADPRGGGYRGDSTFSRPSSGRNPRSVLDVPTAPYKGAHYATFPPNLIAPLIRASCPRRACPECGQGWSPVVEKSGGLQGSWHDHSSDDEMGQAQGDKTALVKGWFELEKNIRGYRPTCECGHEDFVPGIVLDPFIGSGTTGAVAKELQRRWAGLDISMEYLDEQAKIRALNWTPSGALDDLPLFNM